ncbi:ATP-dependent Clp protease proteolytic subunit [Streptomyces lavendofoliae]|uniref:ATP-dependent Clp protease proteolytic subunit n=1 Tax=Streptomyces lavendofoliae TaxID=67314 RepID=A0A918HZ31_9ACTN|nr:ATP-dependent Clp protease proteolytic subunit [Streptomyces lavendofoliae]GGU45762.1 putative ATP-dependent Clp protease proteolytic subunit-like protein [Streptomyces lavendofoliae]
MSHPARYVLPGFTERAGSGTRTVDPYSTLLEERIILLGTPLDDTAANDVIAQLLYLEHAAPDRDISLVINSPGGPVGAMSAVHDTMRAVRCDVGTTCVGQAASTAAVLLAAGTPGKRLALPGSRVLVRQPAPGEPLPGQPSDPDLQAREALRQRDLLAAALSRYTGRDRERVDADLERDTVLDAAGAVAYGLIDQVVTRRAR